MRILVALLVSVLLATAACGEQRQERGSEGDAPGGLVEYRVLVNARDSGGEHYRTFRVAAEDRGRAERLVTQWLKANGADLLAIEEVERRQSLTTEEPGVLHTTGRSYYDSD